MGNVIRECAEATRRHVDVLREYIQKNPLAAAEYSLGDIVDGMEITTSKLESVTSQDVLAEQHAIATAALQQIALQTENMGIAGLNRENALVLLTRIKAAADEALETAAHLTTEQVVSLTLTLRDCKECLMRLRDADGAYRVTCIEEARKALAGKMEPSQARETLENILLLTQDETKPLPHRLIAGVITDVLTGGAL